MHCFKTYSNCIFFHYGLPEQSFNIQFGLQWKKTSLCVRIELLTFTSSHRGHDERSQTGRSPKYLQVARKMVCLNCKRFSRRGMWALVWQLHCLLGIAGELSALTICYSNLFFFFSKNAIIPRIQIACSERRSSLSFLFFFFLFNYY